MSSLVNSQLRMQLRQLPDPEQSGRWPVERLNYLSEAGVFSWGLPTEYGGSLVAPVEVLEGYIDLASVCLTTAFILTQRDAACHRIAVSPNHELRQRFLPDHTAGKS